MDGRSTDILVPEPAPTDFLDKQNPRSLYNKLNKTVRECIDQIPKNTWEHVSSNTYVPHSGMDIRLKQRLHSLALSPNKTILPIPEICHGICPVVSFYALLKDSKRLAYLVLPLKDYKDALEAAQELWLSRVFEVLSLPLTDADGKPDIKVGNLILKAAALIDMRKHGAPVQKNLNVNANINEPSTVEEIDKQLAELEKNKTLPPPTERLPQAMDAIVADYKEMSLETVND